MIIVFPDDVPQQPFTQGVLQAVLAAFIPWKRM